MAWWETVVDSIPVKGDCTGKAITAHIVADREEDEQQCAETGVNVAGIATTAAKAAAKATVKALTKEGVKAISKRALKLAAKQGTKAASRAARKRLIKKAVKQ